MNKLELLNICDNNKIIMLSTVGLDKIPETRALINIRNSDIAPHLTKYFKKNDNLFFITNTQSDKIKEINANHEACLYMFDSSIFEGLLLKGKAVEIFDDKIKSDLWDDSWKMYYPDGKDGGDFSVIEFIPSQFKSYQGFNVKKGDVE